MRHVLQLLAAWLCTTALAAAAGSPNAGRVTLGVVNWIGYGPIYCAAANGDYRRYGPEVKLVTFSDNSLMSGALAGGELDASTLTYDQVLIADARGWNLKVVMPVDYSVGGDAIVTGAAVQSVQQLKGRRVAFQPLSPSDFLLAYALKSNGLTAKDIDPLNMTPEAIPGAMASGSLPIGVTYEPNVSQILGMPGSKFHVVYSSKQAPGLITDVLVFDAKTIAKRQAAIKAMIQGYVDGLAYMQSHPDESAEIIGKVLGVSATEAKAQMSGVYNIPLAEMGKNFEKSDATSSFFGSGAVIAQLLKDNGQIPAIPDFAQTFDASFVQAMAK